MRYLRVGLMGPDVLAWETFLRGLHPSSKMIVDGIFDADTAEETKEFQRSVGFIGGDVDGVVGNMTLAKAALHGFKLASDDSADLDDKLSPSWPSQSVKFMSSNERLQAFGSFSYVAASTEHNPEAIKITDGWDSKNIEAVTIPQLIGVSGAPSSGRVFFNKRASKQLVDLFQAWEAAGLKDRILTWGGSYNPRFIRGSRTNLSNHAWGSAFDINVQWNMLGTVPALYGKKGCVRELVQIANEHGFFWGGEFQQRADGMHFEICKIL